MFLTTEKRVAKIARAGKASILRADAGQAPLGFAAGDVNLYRYVGNSPTNATDPSGLEPPNAPISLNAYRAKRSDLLNQLNQSIAAEESAISSNLWDSAHARSKNLRAAIAQLETEIASAHPYTPLARPLTGKDSGFYSKPTAKDKQDNGISGVIIYEGKDVADILGINVWSEDWETLSKGCIGLNKLRLGLDTKVSHVRLPGVRVFDNLDDALRVQADHKDKEKVSILFAAQSVRPYSSFKEFLLPGSTSEYTSDVLNPGKLAGYDYMTAIQTTSGKIRLWESMPAGANSGNPKLLVKHWAAVPSHNYSTTFYAIVEVAGSRYNPPIVKD